MARNETRAIGKLGPKLVAGENPAFKTDPFFRHKDRPAHKQADQYAGGEHHWREQD
jgi:hypothetical protein